MQKMKLSEILKDQTITTQFDFSGSCPDKDGESVTFNIFNTAYFLNEVNYRFFDRELFVLDVSTAFNELVSRFNTWKNSRGLMFARMAYAYSLGYNPIENYSSIESHTGYDEFENGKVITHKWDEDTIEHAYDDNAPLKVERAYDSNDPLTQAHLYDDDNPLKVTTGHTGDKEVTTYNNVKDSEDHSKYGVNSANAVAVSNDTNTRSGNEEREYKGTRTDTTTGKYTDTTSGKYSDTTTGKYTDTHTGSYSDTNSGTDTTTYNSTVTKSGNIGVMTASQMLASQFEGINQDLPRRALEEFIERTTFYAESVSLW